MSSDSPLVSFYLPNLNEGGVQRMVVNLARGFIEQGIKVDIVLDRVVGPFVEKLPPGARIINLKAPRLRQSVSCLANYMRQEKPRAMLSNLHYTHEIAILAKRLFKLSSDVVIIDHGTPSQTERSPFSQPLNFLGLTPNHANSLIRYFYPWADDIVAVSQGAAQDLARITGLPPARIKVIYNPVVTPELFEKAKEPVDHPWFAPGEPPVILGVGRLVGQKDFSTLIRAFSKVRTSQNARLMILGTGPERSKLESLVNELSLELDVALPGFVSNPYAYMARSAVFVLSSVWEGFGNVLAEAMATGTPVVSTNCKNGAPAEILDNGKYGLLTPVGGSEALAEAILEVLIRENRHKTVDEACLSRFTLAEVTKQYLNIISVD